MSSRRPRAEDGGPAAEAFFGSLRMAVLVLAMTVAAGWALAEDLAGPPGSPEVAIPRVAASASVGESGRQGSRRGRDCDRQPKLEAWLRAQADVWKKELLALPGYEPPGAITVCSVVHGPSYADYDEDRIYLRRVEGQEDRISLAHEYVHLAFKRHPVSRDERFVEDMARKLVAVHAFEGQEP